ncbi:hypothetical protein [Halorientalis halophila]|uniref:hypothetical protein n=1 Tax=Halorientalis halophila TaxID=3108499 RepID=UPI003009EB84
MTDPNVPEQPTGQPEEHNDPNEFVKDIKRRLASLSWLARAASVGVSSLAIAFVLLFGYVLETGGDLTLITRPLPMQLVLALPSLIGALTLGTTAGALLAWRYRYWSLAARIHQTILALLGLLFSWQLTTLGLLP